MKKRRFSVQAVGAASLLTILAVLILVTFALLSVSTVQSQRNLAEATARAVSGYYAADTAAEEYLAELRQSNVPEGLYECSFPISDTQSLEVAVAMKDNTYSIIRWQAVSTAVWEENNDLNVWSGEPGDSQ